MVTIKLWGGLGNQLFQYAYGYQLAKKLDTQIVLDISWFDYQGEREPEILKFNVEYLRVEKTQSKRKIIRLLNSKMINRLIRIPEQPCYKLGKTKYLKETRYKKSQKLKEFCENDVYLDGYWQCPEYFEHIKYDLQRMYVPKQMREEIITLGNNLKQMDSVAVHIRRGDYPDRKVFGSRLVALNEDYYVRAVHEFDKSTFRFVIFSNAREQELNFINDIIGERNYIIDKLQYTALEEWYLMGCCRNQIIGNSTFSWWAAYLNDNLSKKVCAPEKYFGNDDIVPDDWIKISYP